MSFSESVAALEIHLGAGFGCGGPIPLKYQQLQHEEHRVPRRFECLAGIGTISEGFELVEGVNVRHTSGGNAWTYRAPLNNEETVQAVPALD